MTVGHESGVVVVGQVQSRVVSALKHEFTLDLIVGEPT